jgi:hypothetical protein
MQSDVGTALSHKDWRPCKIVHKKPQQLKGQKADAVLNDHAMLPISKETTKFRSNISSLLNKQGNPVFNSK